MNTVVTPKLPKSKVSTGGNRKFHTLHFNGRVFTIQKNGTSIVSFRDKSDAIRFGKLIESHFEITKKWPEINFEDTLLFRVTKNSSRLKYVNMKTWAEKDLVDFCVQNYFSMLDIHRFEHEYRLVGNSLFWEAPMNCYVNMLNNKLLCED